MICGQRRAHRTEVIIYLIFSDNLQVKLTVSLLCLCVHFAWKGCPQNDLYCVGWDVKPYSLTHSLTHPPNLHDRLYHKWLIITEKYTSVIAASWQKEQRAIASLLSLSLPEYFLSIGEWSSKNTKFGVGGRHFEKDLKAKLEFWAFRIISVGHLQPCI